MKDIVDLFAIVYGKDFRLVEMAVLDNTVDKPQVALAYCSGKLVAHYAVSPTVLCQNGISLKCAQSMTTMTHPNYEGKGLFVNLAKMVFDKLAKEGYQYIRFLIRNPMEFFISKWY